METPQNVVPMPAEKRAELKRLAEAATPGPWRSVWEEENPDPNSHDEKAIIPLNPREGGYGDFVTGLIWYDGPHAGCTKQDAAYIAAVSPDVVLDLLAENEKLSAALATARGELADQKAEKLLLIQETHRWSDAEKRDKVRHQAELDEMKERLRQYEYPPLGETCIHEGCTNLAVYDGHCACYLLGASDAEDNAAALLPQEGEAAEPVGSFGWIAQQYLFAREVYMQAGGDPGSAYCPDSAKPYRRRWLALEEASRLAGKIKSALAECPKGADNEPPAAPLEGKAAADTHRPAAGTPLPLHQATAYKCLNCGHTDWEEIAPGIGCNICEGL